jgi:hypothetical protein
MKEEQMKNLRGPLARDACPVCGGKQKVLTLPDCLEWDEKHKAWVPLIASICDRWSQTTIHTFHPEMFSPLATQDRNEWLAS